MANWHANEVYRAETGALNETSLENVILRSLLEMVQSEGWYEFESIHCTLVAELAGKLPDKEQLPKVFRDGLCQYDDKSLQMALMANFVVNSVPKDLQEAIEIINGTIAKQFEADNKRIEFLEKSFESSSMCFSRSPYITRREASGGPERAFILRCAC
jgi:hypothetical protein